jgi:hypothetical protein
MVIEGTCRSKAAKDRLLLLSAIYNRLSVTLGISEWHCAARRNGRFSQIGPEGWIGRF